MLQRKLDGKGPGAFEELAVEGKSWKRRRIVAGYGECWGKTSFQGMWEFLSLQRVKAKTFLKDAEKEKQEGIQGQRQRESPAKDFLEQVKSCAGTDCTPKMMK